MAKRSLNPFAAALASPRAARRAGGDYGQGAEPDWRRVDWQAHLRQVQIDGARVNFVDIGEGDAEPVVFIHGLGGQWQNWLENIPRFSRDRRVIALDLPGFGRSEVPPERITISGYGRTVSALCDQLALGPAVFVGNSMGGFVSSEIAIQQPERVERLVLVSAAGISSASARRRKTLTTARIVESLATYTAARHRWLAARPVTRHIAVALVARHPALLRPDLVYESMMKGSGSPGYFDALRACLEYDFRDRLPEISCPTLIVWGENDAVVPVRDAQEFERLIPDTRTIVMEETGHVPQLERPEAFNRALAEFLVARSPGLAVGR
jgi:pimeloyl-ACP methyl ester carboxylesterase